MEWRKGMNREEALKAYPNLSGANLSRADLSGADLSNTIYDPNKEIPTNNQPNSLFEEDGEFLIGYRTASSRLTPGMGLKYQKGFYQSPLFNLNPNEDCSHGLYVAPSIQWLVNNKYKEPFVMVKFLKHQALVCGDKVRVRGFYVVGPAQ
jgi:hypothetical protein